VLPEGLGQLKDPVTLSGIEPMIRIKIEKKKEICKILITKMKIILNVASSVFQYADQQL
jgi:hypothetical protein